MVRYDTQGLDHHRWNVFLAGEIVISLPNSSVAATIQGGRRGLVLAVDTKERSTLGHYSKNPSHNSAVAMMIPAARNEVPSHRILHTGPCATEEQNY